MDNNIKTIYQELLSLLNLNEKLMSKIKNKDSENEIVTSLSEIQKQLIEKKDIILNILKFIDN